MLKSFQLYNKSLSALPAHKLLISTLNAHSYNLTHSDAAFAEALQKSDVLIPDGISVVYALRWLSGQKLTKIAGADLFFYEMNRLSGRKAENGDGRPEKTYEQRPKAFFLGSSEGVLEKIKERAGKEFPNVAVHTYSPPYKPEFTEEDNQAMLAAINAVQPEVLFVGMTAPKQEKWAYAQLEHIQAGHICCIGAVFDFYAGTVQRAPQWLIKLGLEWFYRLVKEPKRLWRRYLVGNAKFVGYVLREKMKG